MLFVHLITRLCNQVCWHCWHLLLPLPRPLCKSCKGKKVPGGETRPLPSQAHILQTHRFGSQNSRQIHQTKKLQLWEVWNTVEWSSILLNILELLQFFEWVFDWQVLVRAAFVRLSTEREPLLSIWQCALQLCYPPKAFRLWSICGQSQVMQVTKSGSRHGISNLSFKDCEEHSGKIFASLKKHPVQHPVTSKILEVRNIYSSSHALQMYKMNWRDRFRTNDHRYAYTLLQQNTSLTFTYNIVHMVSTDKAKFFDRPEKLPERERPRSFVPLRSHVGSPEQSNIKRAKCIGHLHAPRRCFRIKLEWRVGNCEFFRSHHKEKSLPCVVLPWELFFKVCMSFPERKTMSNYISLFNSFMMLAIWPLLLGLVRSEAGRWTLPGIKWAQCLVASLITKATCYRTIDRFDELEISLEDIIFIDLSFIFIIWPHRWLHVLLQMRLHLCKQLPRWFGLMLDFLTVDDWC